jgi:hypothetical protein
LYIVAGLIYIYTADSPINSFDPTGHDSIIIKALLEVKKLRTAYAAITVLGGGLLIAVSELLLFISAIQVKSTLGEEVFHICIGVVQYQTDCVHYLTHQGTVDMAGLFQTYGDIFAAFGIPFAICGLLTIPHTLTSFLGMGVGAFITLLSIAFSRNSDRLKQAATDIKTIAMSNNNTGRIYAHIPAPVSAGSTIDYGQW